MLRVENVEVAYGNIKALKGVSLEVEKGEIVSIIGANGAGKSTMIKAITGLQKIQRGKTFFMDKEITYSPAHSIVGLGISCIPEGRQIFPRLTVLENLMMGGYLTRERSILNERILSTYELFPILKDRSLQLAGTLSGGEQQMLAMGRGLMANPKILLLDEPSMGLSPLLVKTIFSIIKKINQTGTSVLLVEQNARMALTISHRGYVLETGYIKLQDTGKALLNSQAVRKAYLGES